MAVAFDAATAGAYSGATSVTINHTAGGADRVALACIPRSADTSAISSITYGGTNMVSQIDHAVAARGQRSSIHSHIAPATSSQAMIANFSEAAYGYAGVISVTGADQTTPVSGTATGSGTTASPSFSVTSATDELVIDSLKAYNPTVTTPGAGQTQRFSGHDGTWGERGFGSTEAGATSVTMSWTLDFIDSSAGWVGCAVSMKASGGAPAGQPTMRRWGGIPGMIPGPSIKGQSW